MSSDIKTVNLTLAIPMRMLGNERRAIDHKLNSLISQYIPEADGVLIKWSDLNILNDKGLIIDDQPFIFWKVSFTAHVFRPIEGKTVKGRVHRIQKNYFIAKAMDSFTVTVSIPEDLMDHKVIQHLMIERDAYFKIKGSSEGIYRGEVDEECLKLTKALLDDEIVTEDNVFDYAKDFEY